MASKDSESTTARRSSPEKDDGVSINLFVAIFIFRVINALSIKTFFQPDEYFQALEPAWQTAFGNESGAWITWEWHEHLRSSFFPLTISVGYLYVKHLCEFFHVTLPLQARILIAVPKIQQAFWATFMDVFTHRLACKVYGQESRASRAALALTLLSPWQWFCSTRTLSNSLETTFTIMALTTWPWDWYIKQEKIDVQSNGDGKKRQRFQANDETSPFEAYSCLIGAALACILRPTNVLIWLILVTALLWLNPSKTRFVALTQAAVVCGGAVLAESAAVDLVYYGKWVFPPLNFLYFNIVQSLAVFYGTNRVSYYFTEGLGLLLTTAIPFAMVGLWQGLFAHNDRTMSPTQARIRYLLAMIVVVSLIVPTFLAHKEVRFIYPLLPMLHILAAKPLADFFNPFPIPKKNYRLAILVLGVAVNVFIAFYTGFVHQRGVIDVTHYLRYEQETKLQFSSIESNNMTVGFLMPCHSTPWRSHLVHPSIHAWALTCEPPLGLSMAERESYMDEADQFYADPALWIEQNMNSRETITKGGRHVGMKLKGDSTRREWPEYLAFFQQLEPTMKQVLQGSRYRECWRGFNTHWHDDWRRQGDVIVWCEGRA